MVSTLCDSGSAIVKAGEKVSTKFTTKDEAFFGYSSDAGTSKQEVIDELINQAESFINDRTQVDWVALYSGLSTDLKKILEDAASSHAAISMINYNMGGYTSRQEAQTMLDVNYSRLTDAIRELKEKVTTDFIKQV